MQFPNSNLAFHEKNNILMQNHIYIKIIVSV